MKHAHYILLQDILERTIVFYLFLVKLKITFSSNLSRNLLFLYIFYVFSYEVGEKNHLC